MSLRELLRAYDEQQAALAKAANVISASPAASASTLSSRPSSSSLDSIQEEDHYEPVHQQPESSILATFLSVVPHADLCAPSTSARASLRAAVGLPDLASLPPLRAYEHLATLLPKSSWKVCTTHASATGPESDPSPLQRHGSRCDMWNCDTQFSLFDGRRHCRKCGGIFCKEHVARTTALIDMSRAPAQHTPHGRHIQEFNSTLTPVVDSIVCDGCHDLIHGVVNTPRWNSGKARAVASDAVSLPEPAAPKERRTRRRSTKSSSNKSMLASTTSSGSHPSLSSGSLTASPLAATPPNPLSRSNSRSNTTHSAPTSPAGYVPPALCDEHGQPLSAGLATLRMLQLGRAGALAPVFDPAVLDAPLGVTKRMAEREERLRNLGQPRQPTPQELLQTYPLCVPSAVCKARASQRRRDQYLEDLRRAGRLVDAA